MWAGYIPLVNQKLASVGKSYVGFLNPTIYRQNAQGGDYGTDFHDIIGGASGKYSAVTGDDLVTGWGSPTPSFINTLTQ
jgi:kumamolisin